jgi:hypothetical protein
MAVMLESRPPSTVPDLDEPAAPALVDLLEAPAPRSTSIREVPVAGSLPTRRSHRWRRSALSPTTARLAGLLMFAGFVATGAVEPPANGPEPVLPFWADALGNGTLVVLLGCFIALTAGRRSGLWLGTVAGAGLVTMTALCPAMDHHTIAGWWWAQLIVGVGIIGLSAGLLAGTRSARSARRSRTG